jgi:hypothetical protein
MAADCHVIGQNLGQRGPALRLEQVPDGSAEKALLVGAKTKNGPALWSVSTRRAALTTATRVVWSAEFTALSTMSGTWPVHPPSVHSSRRSGWEQASGCENNERDDPLHSRVVPSGQELIRFTGLTLTYAASAEIGSALAYCTPEGRSSRSLVAPGGTPRLLRRRHHGLSAIALGPRPLHIPNDGRIDDQAAKGCDGSHVQAREPMHGLHVNRQVRQVSSRCWPDRERQEPMYRRVA